MRPFTRASISVLLALVNSARTVNDASFAAGRLSLVRTAGERKTIGPVAKTCTSRQIPISLSGGIGAQSTSVIARSRGCGGNTSTARAFISPVLAADVTSNWNRRQVPITLSDEAIRTPFIQTFVRKLIPSKPSQKFLPL